MTGGQYCWCSGVVSPGTPLADTSCSTDCIDDPAGNKRKCGGSGNIVSIWKLEEEYCPFKSRLDASIVITYWLTNFKQNVQKTQMNNFLLAVPQSRSSVLYFWTGQ